MTMCQLLLMELVSLPFLCTRKLGPEEVTITKCTETEVLLQGSKW